MSRYDQGIFNQFCCSNWTQGCIKWTAQNGSSCNRCILRGRDVGSRGPYGYPDSSRAAESEIESHPALNIAYWLLTCVQNGQWTTQIAQGAQNADVDELVVATYKIMTKMRSTVAHTLNTLSAKQPNAEAIRDACIVLRKDYSSYPDSLVGLTNYFEEHAKAPNYEFFSQVARQLRMFARPPTAGGRPMVIYADPKKIDCLLRPETFQYRRAIQANNKGNQALRMMRFIMEQNVQIQCRPALLDKDNLVTLLQALHRALQVLMGAVARSQARYNNEREYKAAAEIRSEYGRYIPYLPKFVDFRDRCHQDGVLDRPARATLLCRVMEAIVFSTSRDGQGQRIVTNYLPRPFPKPE